MPYLRPTRLVALVMLLSAGAVTYAQVGNTTTAQPTPTQTAPTNAGDVGWVHKVLTNPIATFTLLLVVVAGIQVLVYVAMHRTTKRVERAYLAVRNIRLVNFQAERPLQLSVHLVNTGHLPAQPTSHAHVLVINEDLPDDPPLAGLAWGGTGGVVPPQGEIFMTAFLSGEPSLTVDEWNRLARNDLALHVCGAFPLP